MHRISRPARVAAFLCAFLCLGLAALAQTTLPCPLQLPGMENAFQVTERIFSGGQPEGDTAWPALRALGIKTIISVDGGKPDVETAARFGLRYIHLPHGYDGIAEDTRLKLIKAAQTAEGPLYLHCHHGKHRGPAAVGIICQATAGWTTNRAAQWLKQAGTAIDYAGLYEVNASFQIPAAERLRVIDTNFPARVEMSGLVEAMVEVDRRWDHLKAIQQAGWGAPAQQPDLIPRSEALLLEEVYRELQQHPVVQARGREFLDELRRAESSANELHLLLKTNELPLHSVIASRADALAKSIANQCSRCHRRFRDNTR